MFYKDKTFNLLKLYIEKEMLEEFDYKCLIKNFAHQKKQRIRVCSNNFLH